MHSCATVAVVFQRKGPLNAMNPLNSDTCARMWSNLNMFYLISHLMIFDKLVKGLQNNKHTLFTPEVSVRFSVIRNRCAITM